MSTRRTAPVLAAAAWLALLAAFRPAPARADGAPDAVFAAAREAYDADRLEEAAALYRSLEDAGWQGPEVRFNLGNALFRLGRVGEAVRAYRQAQYARPRDPDVRANLAFAWQHGGATPPRETWWRAALLRVSRAEWRVAAVAAYWLAWLALAGWILHRRGRSGWARAAAAAGAALAVALAGLQAWRAYDARPEAVVLGPAAEIRFAPLPGAVIHFVAPPGTVLRIEGKDGDWYKVRLNEREGWMPARGLGIVDAAGRPRTGAGDTNR